MRVRPAAPASPPAHCIFAVIVQQQDTAMPRPRRRCESGWPHHFHASVADTERHLFCKQVHVGAKPTGGPIFIRCFPWCNSSTSLCDGDGAGAEPAGKPNFKSARKAKSPSQWFASPRYPVRVRGARPFLEVVQSARSHSPCFRGVRVLHTAVRRQRLEVQVLAEAPFQWSVA